MKKYHIELQLTKNGWHTVDTYDRQTDALNHVRLNMGQSSYPVRIVRVERTIVFEDRKK